MSHYTVLAAVELPEPDVEYLSQNRLALQVEGQLDDLLAPYEEGTNNPDYLEFVDMEESARLEYLTQTMLCVKMPDGGYSPHIPAYSPICTRSTMERCTNAVAVPSITANAQKRQSGSSWLIIRSGSCSPP